MNQQRINTRTLIGLGAIAIAIVSLLITVPSLASAIFATGPDSQSYQSNLSALLINHEEDLDAYLDRFEGRSLFFKPIPYTAKVIAKAPESAPKTVDPKPLVPPRTYTGPKVIGVFGDEVWFRDNLKIRVGEEGKGVKVLQNNAPWTVKLAHRGGEYDVAIFSDRLIGSGEFSNPLELKSTPGIIYDKDPADSENSGDDKKRERVQQ